MVDAVVVTATEPPPPAVSIASAGVTEGPGAASQHVVTLSAGALRTITVTYTPTSASATAGADFAAASGTVTFLPGLTSQTLSIPVVDDGLDEDDETFTVTLSAPVNATLGTATATGTIVDNDLPPSLSIADVSVPEAGAASLPVTLSAPSGKTITVAYATATGTAAAGTDFAAASGTLTFAPGVTTQQVPVPLIDDTLDEDDETFTVTMSSPANATLGDASGLVTITDDDAAPALAIGPVSVTEDTGAPVTATFTVTLSGASGRTASAAWATAGGTATAGADFTTAGGTVTFLPGETSQAVTVQVTGDALDEDDETFSVTLSAPVSATLGTASATATIVDDDLPPSVSIAATSVAEGDAGTATATFTVSLSAASGRSISVGYATAAGSALPGADFVAASGTVAVAVGTTSQTVQVAVLGDVLDEDDETFSVTLASPVNATLGSATAVGTIVDDDLPPSLAIGDVTVTEGDTGVVAAVFPVTLSAPSGRTVTVSWATGNGTATAGSDYTAGGGSLTFPAGTTGRTASVRVLGDIVFEPGKTFTVTLSAPVNATLADAQGVGTITDDDVLPTAVPDSYATPFQLVLAVGAPGVLANDGNDGGGAMTAQLGTPPAHGSVSLSSDGAFTYTPAIGFSGLDAFTYRVVDGSGAGNTVPVTLAVGLPPPAVASDAYTTPFGTVLDVPAPGVLANDVSHGAPGLAAALVTGPAHGTLVLGSDGSVRYTPEADFTGTDTFTYRASTVVGAGGVGTVTITVAAPTTVQAPRVLRVADVTPAGRITLRWTAAPVGPAPTGYLVEGGVLPNQALAGVVTPDASPILTVDLGPGRYYVRVRAIGAGGPSPVSNEVAVTVGESIAPSTPAGLLASAKGQAVQLAWTPTFSGGGPAGYALDVTGPVTGSVALPAGERASFADVLPGTYVLRLRAVNAARSSAPSAPASITVPVSPPEPAACVGTPGAPESVLAYRRDGVVSVVWDPPTSGAAALGYEVSVSGFAPFSMDGRMLSGAAPSGTYAITVRAVGACGAGMRRRP